MANYKRRHPRRQVRCNMCTDARVGNSRKDWGGRRAAQVNEAHREAAGGLTMPPMFGAQIPPLPDFLQGAGLLMRVVVPRKPPTENDLTVGPRGQGRWRYANAIRVWGREVEPAPEHKRACGMKRLVRIVRVVGRHEKAYDQDNFVGGCKVIIDALVRARWLDGDRPNQVLAEYEQHVPPVRSDPATLIEVWTNERHV